MAFNASLYNKNAQVWMPNKFEINIWKWNCSNDTVQPWPKDLPDLNSAIIEHQSDNSDYDLYILFIDKERFDEVEKLREGHIEINDRKMCIDGYDFPLPNLK